MLRNSFLIIPTGIETHTNIILDSRLHPKGASFFEAARGNDSMKGEFVTCESILA